ncbi:LacI family DNA-binding transcriptional regulator [Nocardioides iriomotensis]|uniref:LacI family DNA-binding transcriptional regulator n=1 Tax=Nocardioides iriomotensis TaxID=715784 RepID=A0A4Q5J5M9_9ACTN|nr:LacI family DNA-binding transcriptional regulator [Nocardioides iriomotensis]RYU12881.1 LacI family DNA-binding transcriptional regulator [Nocardioides iriomotensis]
MTEASTPARRATIADVARLAEVSSATVSFVINDKHTMRISEATRERVWAAVRELGYRPNALAKSLSSGSSRFIGVVADAIATTPFAGQLIQGAQDEAWRHGYVLLVANTDEEKDVEAQALRMLLEHQVAGILYSTYYHREVEVPADLRNAQVVLANCYAEGSSLPCVVPDEVQGGRSATDVLLDAGHTRIAFVNSVEDAPATRGRLEGYQAALAARDVPFDEGLVLTLGSHQESGWTAAEKLLAMTEPPTAVFCYNDRVAMGLYDALRERGLRVPADMAVVGFDNQEIIAGHVRPPLTTVALPHYEIGARAVQVLLGLDTGEPSGTLRHVIACPTVTRESV